MRLVAVPALLAVLAAAPASAQAFNLRDLLTDLLRGGITLAPPTGNFPSHEAHFIGADSPQLLAVQEFSNELARQLSSFPLASPAGGFTYRFDSALGVFSRSADSFGPIYAERGDAIGKGKFNVGLNHSRFTFDRIGSLHLADGDLRLVFTHEDTNRDDTQLNLFFEGDVITARLFLKTETEITAFVFTYGVTDRFELSAALPFVKTRLQAQTDATIQRIATPGQPTLHRFLNGGSEESFRSSGSASGIGDVAIRAKLQAFERGGSAVAFGAEARLPTGDERDFLGTGATQLSGFVVGSTHLGAFSPHINAGYRVSVSEPDGQDFPNELSYTAGFDVALHPRLTFAADLLGRTFFGAKVVRVVDTEFRANTTPAPGEPTIVTATFPRLVTEEKDSTNFLGSVGFKVNPFGNLLLTVNGLFSISGSGLRDSFAPLIALDYSF